MDQALKSLIASEEEVVTPLGNGTFSQLTVLSISASQAALSHLQGVEKAWGFQTLSAVTLTTWLFSSLLHPSPTVPSPLSCLTVPSHPTLPHTPAVNVGT
jgi:hypothetical protein